MRAEHAHGHTRLAAALSAGVLVQGLLLFVAHRPERTLRGDEAFYEQQAQRIAAGDSPAPFFLFPPFYPKLIAAVYTVFGPHRLAVELMQSVLLLAAGLLLRRLMLRGGAPPRAADAMLALFLLDPQVASFAQYLWPEIPHLVLALAGVALLVDGTPPSSTRVSMAGVALGLAILTKSLLAPFLPVLVAIAVLRAAGRMQRLRNGLLVAGGICAVVAPVVVANGLRHGYWGVASSGAFNVWVGLNDPASRMDYDSTPLREGRVYLASSSDENERTRILWRRVRERLEREGVVRVLWGQLQKQYVRLFDKSSFFTDQLPGGRWDRESLPTRRSLLLCGWAYLAYGLVIVLSCFGLSLFPWRTRPWGGALPALFLVYNLGLFLVLHVKTRYRVAFLPALLFFAAFAVERALSARELISQGDLTRPGPGLWLGALLAGLMLALAFS